MKRKEFLQTALTSVIAPRASSPNINQAECADSSRSLKNVAAGDPAKGNVPVLTSKNLYTMPRHFWKRFQGRLYIGRPDTDPTRQTNWIKVWLRTKEGKISRIRQPIVLNYRNLKQFLDDDATLLAAAAHSMAVVDKQGQRLFAVDNVTRSNASPFSTRLAPPGGYLRTGEIASIEKLRHTRPLYDRAKIKLRGWHAGSDVGGGEFVGRLTKAEDDGGVTVSSGGDFHWQRVVEDFNRLTLFEFGALADGKTDAADAIRAMYHWSRGASAEICIQFPAGTFLVSGIDLSQEQTNFFRIAGAMVNFGYFPATRLISNGKEGVLFKVNARWVEISNLQINGRNESQPNQQGFFQNVCQAGQFFRGACLRFIQMGGNVLSLMDTLDCKIDQWYASHCQGDVIKVVWSGNPNGVWDHSTAIELSNFNAQHCTKGMVLNLERCTQSLIHNGWIEHVENPGNISNGQWIIDALSMEECKNPLLAHFSRLNMRQINLQSGGRIDNSRQGKEWLSAWERGSTHIESYGATIDGNLKYNWRNARWRLVNNTGQAQWFELGTVWTPDPGDNWEIEIFGQSGYSNGTEENVLTEVVGGQVTGGKAIISLQRKMSKFEGSWYAEGSSPVTEVQIVAPYDTDCRIFVCLDGWVGAAGVLLTSNARDRFMVGRCARFDASMEKKSPSSADGSHSLPQRFTLHNGKAGIGANEQGDFMMASRALHESQVDTSQPAGYVSVMINGKPAAIPWFRIKS